MDEERVESGEEKTYQPRPKWQVWLARLGLVAFLAVLVIYYLTYFRGGA